MHDTMLRWMSACGTFARIALAKAMLHQPAKN
jgi:hypothetical protein